MVGARISGLVHALGWLVSVADLRSPHAANAHATESKQVPHSLWRHQLVKSATMIVSLCKAESTLCHAGMVATKSAHGNVPTPVWRHALPLATATAAVVLR